MKNKLKYFIIFIIIIASMPILPVLEESFYGFFAFLNFHGLSSLALPILISLPLIYKNKNFYFFYILLIPILYNFWCTCILLFRLSIFAKYVLSLLFDGLYSVCIFWD